MNINHINSRSSHKPGCFLFFLSCLYICTRVSKWYRMEAEMNTELNREGRSLSTVMDNQFEKGTVKHMNLHVLPTKRYKTYAISVYFGVPLQEDTVTKVALTPFVLRRGNKEVPLTKQFRERLDDLYGAGFGFDVYKRGNYQIVQFRMDIINDQFVKGEKTSLLEQAMQFIGTTLTEPATEKDSFVSKYVDAEKNTLQERLESIINDKIRYAAERCVEEMCRDEVYRIHPLGKQADLAEINPQNLFESYKQWLQNAAIDIYVVGDTTLEQVQSMVQSSFKLDRSKAQVYESLEQTREVKQIHEVIDELEVKQGKLNLGLRSSIKYGDNNYPAMLLYNGILGGYPHSKLFVNVREKASLAYYAASRFDGHKGLLTIQSGIEIENYDKAVDIIKQQLESMRKGEITDLEINQTKAMITNQLRELQDTAFETIAFDFNAVLSGKNRGVEDLIQSVETIDREQIKQAANQVELDTIYFLRDRKGVPSS
jgi:predicted Zn-dependent peptidase